MSDFVFISESVTEGHPDKLCDQIATPCVDRFLRQDPHGTRASPSARCPPGSCSSPCAIAAATDGGHSRRWRAR